MTRHRFINDGRSPIPMGSTAEYTCVCGKRGTYEALERHITDSNLPLPSYARDGDECDGPPTAPHNQLFDHVIESDDFGGGDTMAHYLPNAPRKPAPTGESLPLQRPGTPEPLPPPPSISAADRPRSIAELFQDMLRSAFQAGTASTTTGDSFETWYQREVLQ